MARYPVPLSATLAVTAALALARGAHAADEATCSVRLVGEDDARGYREAVTVEDARVGKLDEATHDCRLIEVHVTLDGAVVVFTTRDGRQAVRRIASPAELGSTIDALLVTTPPAAATGPSVEPPAAKVEPTPGPKPAPRGAPAPAPARTDPMRVIASMDAGARFAAPGPFVSPTIALGAHVLVRRWELGADLAIEPYYGTPQSTPAGFQMIGSAVSIALGRREPLGSAFELLAMGRATAAIVHEEIEATTEFEETQGSRAELRLGASAAVVYARASRVRVRATLGGDYAPKPLAGGRRVGASLPVLPTWGATLSVGVEADLL